MAVSTNIYKQSVFFTKCRNILFYTPTSYTLKLKTWRACNCFREVSPVAFRITAKLVPVSITSKSIYYIDKIVEWPLQHWKYKSSKDGRQARSDGTILANERADILWTTGTTKVFFLKFAGMPRTSTHISTFVSSLNIANLYWIK